MEQQTQQQLIDTSLFTRLGRLFKNDVVIRNVGGKQLKVTDTDNVQGFGSAATNSLIDRFTRLYRHNSFGGFTNPTLNYQYLRPQLYNDYEAMDHETIISSALDIVSDECSRRNENGEILQIRSDDENIQAILHNLFYDVLNIDFNLWPWIRSTAKYGDHYLHLEIHEKFGVYKVQPLSVYDVVREEGITAEHPDKILFKVDPRALGISGNIPSSRPKDGEGRIILDNYEVAHFRLLTDSNYLPYGRSYIEPARKTYKQYVLTKDAMLLHRITRAPEKRIYYVNVGGIPPNEVDSYMQKLMQRTKKTPMIDEKTGEYNLRYNVQNMMEDFYVPVRGANDTTKIDTAKGLEYNAIEDVNFLRDEMLAGLKIPKAYFGFEKDLSGKSTLASEDIRFASTVERFQRIIVSELYKIALVHLYTQGFQGDDLTNFKLSLTTPSIVYEQEKISLWKEKVELTKSLLDTKLIPTNWIYHNIYDFSESEIDEMRDLVIEDQKRIFRLSQIEQEGNDPARSGKSFGTPHDLASLYGAGRQGHEGPVPQGYDEKQPVGRPQEKASVINTQQSSLGRDRLGIQGSKPGNPLSEVKKHGRLLKSLYQSEKLNAGRVNIFNEGEGFGIMNESIIKDELV